MKKILLMLLILVLLTGCCKNEYIGDKIEVTNKTCKLVQEKDTHGGFLGDGDYFALIECDKLRSDELSDNWKVLPLSENILEIMNMPQCDGDGCKTVFNKYEIPEIKNGYYLFKDRHSSSNNKYDDTELNIRSSYNFSLSIFDKDNNKIYLYELDT